MSDIDPITSRTDQVCGLADDAARCFSRGEDARGYVYRDLHRMEVRKLIIDNVNLRIQLGTVAASFTAEHDCNPATDREDRMTRKGEFIVPATAISLLDPLRLNTVPCKSCLARVIWIKTAAGKNMPLSAATVEMRDGVGYALSHFSDCPNAKEHRRC